MDEHPAAKQIIVFQCTDCGHIALNMDSLAWHKKKHDPFYDIDRLWMKNLLWEYVNEKKSSDEDAHKEYYIHTDEGEEIISDEILFLLIDPADRKPNRLLSGMGQYHKVCLLYVHGIWSSDKRLVGALIYENLPTYPWLDEYYQREAILIDPFLPMEYKSFIQGTILKHEAEARSECY
jgi:hypothetical protein